MRSLPPPPGALGLLVVAELRVVARVELYQHRAGLTGPSPGPSPGTGSRPWEYNSGKKTVTFLFLAYPPLGGSGSGPKTRQPL